MTGRRLVLVLDDEDFVRESLVDVLEGAPGLTAVPAADLGSALAQVDMSAPDVILADLQMPGGGAMELMAALAERGPAPPVIVITGVGTIDNAVEAMRRGAFDFVQKPVPPDQLLLVVDRALEHGRLLRDVDLLRRASSRRGGALVGDSPAMVRVRELVEQVAPTDSTVLVTGESGTGKELVAEAIHQASSRAGHNLVRVNCAAVPEALFESEFFGHRRGSFSGAVSDRTGRFGEAEGGTLVLDEIGTLRPEVQAKLLRALESGEYQVVGESRPRTSDARIVAITNEPLLERVEQGSFRADLYYRLAIFPIEIPPLRERKADIPVTAAYLVDRLRGATAGPASLPEEVAELLVMHDWPGNGRELRNVLERALIMSGGGPIEAGTVRSLLESSVRHQPPSDEHALHLRSWLEAAEKDVLRQALERSGGVRKRAAELLGIDPRNLSYYLRKHGLHGGRGARDDEP